MIYFLKDWDPEKPMLFLFVPEGILSPPLCWSAGRLVTRILVPVGKKGWESWALMSQSMRWLSQVKQKVNLSLLCPFSFIQILSPLDDTHPPWSVVLIHSLHWSKHWPVSKHRGRQAHPEIIAGSHVTSLSPVKLSDKITLHSDLKIVRSMPRWEVDEDCKICSETTKPKT